MTERPNPAAIFEALNAHHKTAALRGAIELGLFTCISEGKHSAEEIAQACAADARGVRILCDYLVVQEFLTKQGSLYHLTPATETFLVKGQPAYMGDMLPFINSPDLMKAFENVAETVRRGGTLLDGQGTVSDNYAGWVEFARGMAPMMMPPANFIARLAKELREGPIRVLDIAAGHGLFGIMLAKENPEAHIVALDWEPVLAVAAENAQLHGVAERHELLPGNALEIDYGRGFDVVLLTNFMHHFEPATCKEIAAKSHACLNNGGIAITLEFIPDDDRVSPANAATFALTMLATTPSGDAYTFAEYQEVFGAAGFAGSELVEIPDSPQRLVVSRK